MTESLPINYRMNGILTNEYQKRKVKSILLSDVLLDARKTIRRTLK